jgi:hypothetical protein
MQAQTLFWWMLGAALLSSAITLTVVFLVVHFYSAPRLEQKVDDRLQQGAADLEERLRQRVLNLVTGGKAVKDLARGIGLFGARQNNRDLADDDDLPPR